MWRQDMRTGHTVRQRMQLVELVEMRSADRHRPCCLLKIASAQPHVHSCWGELEAAENLTNAVALILSIFALLAVVVQQSTAIILVAGWRSCLGALDRDIHCDSVV